METDRSYGKILFAALLILLLLLIAPLFNVAAQTKKRIARKTLPAAVLTAYQKDSNNVKAHKIMVKEADGQTLYEIEGSPNGKRTGWIYSADGKLIETEESINLSDLPAAVSEVVKKEHPDMKIDKVEKVTRDGSLYAYEIEAEDGKKEVELRIDPNGKIIEQETLKSH